MQDFSKIDLQHTRRALDLAELGVGQVSPNPLVGCVIVSQSGEVVGEGTYIYEHVTHAEAIALAQAGEHARGGTAYVSLEPHSHQNRTPPCTEALINAGITRVVCPIEDPNPLVAGKGFQVLRESGIEVVTGILAEEARKQNEKFICWHQNGRPLVHLKIAASLDGKISTAKGKSTVLSGVEALKRVHEFRHEHDAILIGSETALIDNPSLTDRSGKPRRRKLVRVILDNRLRISEESILIKTAAEIPTIVVSNSKEFEKLQRLETHGIEVTYVDSKDLHTVLTELGKRGLQSVLVEGGAEIAGSFLAAGLIDKITLMIAPVIIGGSETPSAFGEAIDNMRKLDGLSVMKHGGDVEITAYPQK